MQPTSLLAEALVCAGIFSFFAGFCLWAFIHADDF